MGRGRFFPFPFHGTKETTRTHAPALFLLTKFSQQKHAAAEGVEGPSARSAVLVGEFEFARREFIFLVAARRRRLVSPSLLT